MKHFNYFFTVICIALFFFKADASVISNATGSWATPATWLRNGVAGVPQGGDTVFIRSFDVVTVNSQVTITGAPVGITVAGGLAFTNGNKLDLPCGSYVRIMPGGSVYKSTPGGGSSTMISICGIDYWNAGDGPLSGPVYLPVILLHFDAKANNRQVDLSWSTGVEVNNDYFVIQRSSDNSDYSDILQVRGAGNTALTCHYSAVDEEPINGYNYYRLCQVDYDGSRHYFPPVVVIMNGKGNIIVYPNPSTAEKVSVLYDGKKEIAGQLEVKDISGKTVFTRDHLVIRPGFNKLFMDDFSQFQTGTYFISITFPTESVHQKLVLLSGQKQ